MLLVPAKTDPGEDAPLRQQERTPVVTDTPEAPASKKTAQRREISEYLKSVPEVLNYRHTWARRPPSISMAGGGPTS